MSINTAELVLLSGIIRDIKHDRTARRCTVRVECVEMKKTFTLVIHSFSSDGNFLYLPLNGGDIVVATCYEGPGGNFYSNKLPLFSMGDSREVLVFSITKALGNKNYGAANRLYDIFAALAGSPDKVASYLLQKAQEYHDNFRTLPSEFLSGSSLLGDATAMNKLLNWWYREKNLRQLKLLGLTEEEILSCHQDCSSVYSQCLRNPYVFVGIPLDKCDQIFIRLGTTPPPLARELGQVTRGLLRNSSQRGWTGTPRLSGEKEFPLLKVHRQQLIEEYGVVLDKETYYLRYQHLVETSVADWLIAKASETSSSLPYLPSSTNERKLSPDQSLAVKETFSRPVTVLTGGAGTGKCLGYDTLLVLFSGELKKVQDIVPGDQLMGPDSRPRRVLSTTTGRGELFSIKPVYGRSFVCNAEHVLTLSNGRKTWDISLAKYLRKPRGFLRRAEIDFPETFVSVDPYLFGVLTATNHWPIPSEYRINSRKIRRQFLHGYFSSSLEVPPQHVDDLSYILNSLGLHTDAACCLTERMPSSHLSPFLVRSQGRGNYYGFTLDKDGRFLLSDFLITHNTTCIKELVGSLESTSQNYMICSFTGKAVSRVHEVTGSDCCATMHRMIANNRYRQPYDHIIIDEASMVTTELFYQFIQAIPDIKKITFVGDVNQLPPIGWGNLMAAILLAGVLPVYRLSTNYRVFTVNGEEDGIISNANAIVGHQKGEGFEFYPTANFNVEQGGIDRVSQIILACSTAGIAASDLVVLTPFNSSIPFIQKDFQDIYLPTAPFFLDSRGSKWILGDRVMLKENDSEIGVYNGECGVVREIGKESLTVDFSGRSSVEFSFESAKGYRSYNDRDSENQERLVTSLAPASVLTVDKSQGSEWNFVIIFLPSFKKGTFMNRNRLYTAITRCKRACWLVVDDILACEDIPNVYPGFSCENLEKRLQEGLTVPEILNTFQVDTDKTILPQMDNPLPLLDQQ